MIKALPDDTIGDFKKLLAAQIGTDPTKISEYDKLVDLIPFNNYLIYLVLKKGYTVYKDHITLADYEIHNGMNLELYYA